MSVNYTVKLGDCLVFSVQSHVNRSVYKCVWNVHIRECVCMHGIHEIAYCIYIQSMVLNSEHDGRWW